MGNCCRLIIDGPGLELVSSIFGELACVKTWGENPIVNTSESHFGNIPPKMGNAVEVNFINSVRMMSELAVESFPNALNIWVQDLDGYGIETFFLLRRTIN